MQQTNKYKLNLIETSDPFSPAALNENAQKTEAAIMAEASARQAETAALSQRVTAVEVHKIAVGHYAGNDAASRTIALGFTPVAVLVHGVDTRTTFYGALAVTGNGALNGITPEVSIVENGFQVFKATYTHFNHSGYEYNYIALA